MTEYEFKKFQEEVLNNENFQKSCSIYKYMQFMKFVDGNKTIEGQKIRKEDANGIFEGEENYDSTTSRLVIFYFKNGLLHSVNEEPAIQFPGHYEMWNHGMLEKVVDYNLGIIEIWKDGLPISFEKI